MGPTHETITHARHAPRPCTTTQYTRLVATANTFDHPRHVLCINRCINQSTLTVLRYVSRGHQLLAYRTKPISPYCAHTRPTLIAKDPQFAFRLSRYPLSLPLNVTQHSVLHLRNIPSPAVVTLSPFYLRTPHTIEVNDTNASTAHM